MPSTQPTLPLAKKAPKKRRLSLAVSDIYRLPESLSDSETGVLEAVTRHTDTLDFPEGQEDPAQSAELEWQQDA